MADKPEISQQKAFIAVNSDSNPKGSSLSSLA
jgi:hypothetical protein